MKMNKAYIDQECVMCQTYGNFLQKRSSQISIKNQLELSKEDIERDEIVYERDNLRSVSYTHLTLPTMIGV